MAINNTYVLEVDMKRQMTQRVPKFRKGDSGILIFKLFDDGMEYDITAVTKAELYHKTSKGNIIESKCDFIQYEGKRAIRYVYETVAMVETGINETLLVVYEGDKTVSIQPFPVVIYDDFKGGAGSFVELIQELQNKINGLVMDLTQTIRIAEKGKPNGVATLDASGKIPFAQLPSQIDAYIDHITHTVWKNQVHGLRLNDDGILQYKTGNGSWQNVNFAEDALGGGGAGTQFLDVEIKKSNGVVTLTYKGLPTVQLQKIAKGDFEKPYFLTNGSTFTGTSLTVTELGLYTLYYKDSNGQEYVKLFNIEVSHLPTPTISVSVNNGDATVNISATTSIKKWAKGSQSIAYFQSQGTVFTGNTFTVDSVGVYTIYYKTSTGVEYVHEFTVNSNQLAPIAISHVIFEGLVTMSISSTQSITLSKWADGNQTITYFQTQGTVFTGNTFTISKVGDYTVYYKLSNNQEVIYNFSANFKDVTAKLPVILEYSNTLPSIDEKFRSLKISARNAYKFVVHGGDYNPNKTSYTSDSEFDPTYKTMNDGTLFDITSTSSTYNIDVYNSSNIIIHTLEWKTTSLYNYIVVDDKYISLERIKSNSTTVTVPTTIDGLPVLDIGTIYCRNSAVHDSYNVENVIIPKEILQGGSFCHDTLMANTQKKLKSVTINNSDFTFAHKFALYQETPSYTIKVPANSNTLTKVNKLYNPYAFIQTF